MDWPAVCVGGGPVSDSIGKQWGKRDSVCIIFTFCIDLCVLY